MIFVIFFLFGCYASWEGIRDAYFFSDEHKKINMHPILFNSRLNVGMLAAVCLIANITGQIDLVSGAITCICLAMSFPFFQLTAYFEIRKKLGHPTYNWRTDKSHTSDAKMKFTFAQRVTLVIFALCIISYLQFS